MKRFWIEKLVIDVGMKLNYSKWFLNTFLTSYFDRCHIVNSILVNSIKLELEFSSIFFIANERISIDVYV